MFLFKGLLCQDIRKTTLFYAAQQGDIQFIQQHKHLAGIYDKRESDGEKKIFRGFYAVHYAILYDQLEALQALLPLEYSVLTKYGVNILYPNNAQQQSSLHVNKGQDILMMAIIFKKFELAKKILDYSAQTTLLARVNDMKYSHLMAMAKFRLTPGMRDLFMNSDLSKEFTLASGLQNYTLEIVAEKRIDHMLMLLQFLQQTPFYVATFFYQITTANKGISVFDLAAKNQSFEQSQNFENDRQFMIQLCSMIIPQAIRHLEQHLVQYNQHLSQFFANNKFQYDANTKPISIQNLINIVETYLKKEDQQQK